MNNEGKVVNIIVHLYKKLFKQHPSGYWVKSMQSWNLLLNSDTFLALVSNSIGVVLFQNVVLQKQTYIICDKAWSHIYTFLYIKQNPEELALKSILDPRLLYAI